MERFCRVPFLPLYLTGKPAIDRDLFAVVDEEHYQWALQWKWQAVCSKQGTGYKEKWYASRSTRLFGRPTRVFLHKEILLRSQGMPPSPRYIIGDHMNGDSLDCRASNLRWATPRENRQNYNGMFAMQLRLDFGHTPRYLNRTQEKRDGRRTDGQERRTRLPHPTPPAGAPDAVGPASDVPF